MRMIANLLRNPHGILPEKAEIFDGDEATVQAA
jgi:anthranilate synthase